MLSESVKNVADAAPPTATAVSILWYGVTLTEWAAIFSIVLLFLQMLFLIWRWHKAWKREQAGLPPLKELS